MKQIEQTHGEEIEEILRYLFVEEENTLAYISRTLNISYPTVVRWLKLAGIRHRKIDLGD